MAPSSDQTITTTPEPVDKPVYPTEINTNLLGATPDTYNHGPSCLTDERIKKQYNYLCGLHCDEDTLATDNVPATIVYLYDIYHLLP